MRAADQARRFETEDLMLVRIGDGECHLPFWGHIIDFNSVVRANIVDLGNAWGCGPQWFSEGGQYMTLQRTDCCVAWLFSPIPQRKKKHTESLDEQDPFETLRVKHADVELDMSWGEKVVYYALVFVDIAEHKHVQQAHLHRALISFDTENWAKPLKNEAKTDSFACCYVFPPLAAG